jgi:hypothetical protein
MKRKIGISLIVLIITIIVIIILAGAVILNLVNSSTIGRTIEATFKANIDTYNSELTTVISNKYINDPTFDIITFNTNIWDEDNTDITGTIKEYISSMTPTDGKEFIISKGKLVYVGTDSNKKQWAVDAGVTLQCVTNGLILWLDGLNFTNSPHTTSLIDKSGNGNNATPNNFDYTTLSGSDNKGGIVFNGTNYLDCGNAVSLNLTGSITLEAFVYKETQTAYAKIISKRSGSAFYFLGCLDSNKFYIGIGDGTTIKTLETTLPYANGFYHVLGYYNKTTGIMNIYVNGVLAGTSTSTLTIPVIASPLYVGAENGGNYFKGIIYTIRLYNRVLNDNEIQQNYNVSK